MTLKNSTKRIWSVNYLSYSYVVKIQISLTIVLLHSLCSMWYSSSELNMPFCNNTEPSITLSYLCKLPHFVIYLHVVYKTLCHVLEILFDKRNLSSLERWLFSPLPPLRLGRQRDTNSIPNAFYNSCSSLVWNPFQKQLYNSVWAFIRTICKVRFKLRREPGKV